MERIQTIFEWTTNFLNMSHFEENFCGGQFWNYTLVWHSEQPDFTPCFQKTILSWVPLATILLLSLFELPGYFSRNNKNRNIRLNPFNITKLILTFFLIFTNLAELIYIPFSLFIRTLLLKE